MDKNKTITVTFTKDEADAAFTQLVGKLDDFDNLIKEESKKYHPNVDRIIQLSEGKKKIERAEEKLYQAGASFWC